MRQNIYLVILLAIFIQSCNQRAVDKKFSELRKEFTEEEIRYFFDIVYFNDTEQNFVAGRFKDSVIYYVDTVFNQETNTLISSIFDELSELTGLNINKTTKIENANLYIFLVGSNKELLNSYKTKANRDFDFDDSFPWWGKASYEINNWGYIDFAYIQIKDSLRKSTYPKVFLEEITHCMGLISDSYSYLNSIFYEGENDFMNRYSELDKRIIKLLYSERFPVRVTNKKFYSAFKDILEPPGISQRYYEFEEFIKDSDFSPKSVEMFLECAFSKPNSFVNEAHIQKFHHDIVIKGGDLVLIRELVSVLDSNIPYVDIRIFNNPERETFNLEVLKDDSSFDFLYSKRKCRNRIDYYDFKKIDYKICRHYVYILQNL